MNNTRGEKTLSPFVVPFQPLPKRNLDTVGNLILDNKKENDSLFHNHRKRIPLYSDCGFEDIWSLLCNVLKVKHINKC